MAGASWEGFAIDSLISVAGGRRTPYYYRTEDGAEIDLVFERAGRVEMAIEVKRSTSPALSRGFGSAQALLKPKESYLVHGGTETWTVEGNVKAISLTDLMRRLAESAGN